MARKLLHVLRHHRLTPDRVVSPGQVLSVGDGDDDDVPAKVAHAAVAFGNAREITEEEAAKLAKSGDQPDGEQRDPNPTSRDPNVRRK